MCGIFGQFVWAGPPGDERRLWAATQQLRHRGPDGGGFWADGPYFLGHRRLAIIDIGAGAQPMASADARHVVTFNGEIYNFVELRHELEAAGERFETGSDTEVLLAGYRVWGTGLPRHLRGMFAFALADRSDGSLFVARDRFGEKPLYLHETQNGVTFASELGPIADLIPAAERRIDADVLSAYLSLNYVPGTRSLLGGVVRLAPGSWRRYDREGRKTDGAFWSPADAPTGPVAQDMDGACLQVAAAIDESVRIALRSDVPIALFLSGGIDSSLVAESAVRQGRLSTAYCVDFDDSRFSEFDGASRVARRLGLRLERVPAGPALLADFSRIVAHADDPLADSSAVPVWALSRAVSRDFKVAISGDGGDELFGGYLTYRASATHRRLVARLPMPIRRLMGRAAGLVPTGTGKVSFGYKMRRFLRASAMPTGAAHLSWNGSWLPSEARALLHDRGAGPGEDALIRIATSRGLDADCSLGALQRADISEYLPNDILAKVDRMSMGHGLEVRAPLLTPELSSVGLSLPENLRATLGGGKHVLRQLASRRLGDEIGRAPKQGFSIPIHGWLSGQGRELMRSVLAREDVEAIGALDADRVGEAVERHVSGRAALGFEIWGLMVLTEWWRQRRHPAAPETPSDAELSAHRVSLARAG